MQNREDTIKEIEKKLNITLSNIKLLDIALTHSSYANGKENIKFYERMEFLGDSVLQLSMSEYLFNNYKDKDEGILTKTRALIVCENSLYEVAKKWDLGKYINMSKGEELTGGRNRPSILADCVESIIAAIYLDKGYIEAYNFIISNLHDIITKAMSNKLTMDYKTQLQETLQRNGDVAIDYEVVKFEGPPHRRKFFVRLTSNMLSGYGEGYSKKEAEQSAAKSVLSSLEENQNE